MQFKSRIDALLDSVSGAIAVGFFTTALGRLAGRQTDEHARRRPSNNAVTPYDPDLECFLLQMSVLSEVRMKQRAQELCVLGFERRQQGYEMVERQFDYLLRCHSVANDTHQKWLSALMYTLRCEVERQDLAQLMKRAVQLPSTPAEGPPPLPPPMALSA